MTLNEGADEQTVRAGLQDVLSVPAGSWRSIRVRGGRRERRHRGHRGAAGGQRGDGRVRLEWAPEVVDAAFEAGWMLDPNGYVAPVAVMVTATMDD